MPSQSPYYIIVYVKYRCVYQFRHVRNRNPQSNKKTSIADAWARTRKIFCFGHLMFKRIIRYDNQIVRSTTELQIPERHSTAECVLADLTGVEPVTLLTRRTTFILSGTL